MRVLCFRTAEVVVVGLVTWLSNPLLPLKFFNAAFFLFSHWTSLRVHASFKLFPPFLIYCRVNCCRTFGSTLYKTALRTVKRAFGTFSLSTTAADTSIGSVDWQATFACISQASSGAAGLNVHWSTVRNIAIDAAVSCGVGREKSVVTSSWFYIRLRCTCWVKLLTGKDVQRSAHKLFSLDAVWTHVT